MALTGLALAAGSGWRGLPAREVARRIVRARVVDIWDEGWAVLARARTEPVPAEVTRYRGGLVALMGRIDNRAELLAKLGEPDSALLGNVEIVARLVADGRWDQLGEVLGPFALVVLDSETREIHLGRDALGGRPLCYHSSGGTVIAASAAIPLLQAAGRAAALDPQTLAAYFAVTEALPEATHFAAIRQPRPGELLTLTPEGEARGRRVLWSPPQDLLRLPHDDDYSEMFCELLSSATAARLGPGNEISAVLTSGGLDSTSVAVLASRRQLARGAVPPVAVSWRFRELPASDESSYAHAAAQAAGMAVVWVDGDERWPLRGASLEEIDLEGPFENPYRALHDASFAAAAAAGASVLLSGHFADEMYHGVEGYWLRDAVARGAWPAVREGLRLQRRWSSSAEVWTPRWQTVLGYSLLGSIAERRRRAPPPEWLTTHARAALPETPLPPARRGVQAEQLLSPSAALALPAETRRARRWGVELRFPFRDRRLVELALRLPADQLVRPGYRKRLAWKAAEGVLPDAVRLRRGRTDLGALFVRGLAERERPRVDELLFGAGPNLWREWVREESLREALAAAYAGDPGRSAGLVWRCLAAELWMRALAVRL